MERNDRPHEPWERLQELVRRSQVELSFHRHPSRRVLWAYLQQSLLQRPSHWSKERAGKLVKGRLPDWTMWEVAVHLSSCPRCHSRLKALEYEGAHARTNWASLLWDTLRKPKVAPIGWALAGVQAALIIALVVWMNMVPSSLHRFKVPVYIDINQSSFEDIFHKQELVCVELSDEVEIRKVIELLQGLGLKLVGPDQNGHFLLRKTDGSYLTQENVAIIEQLKAHPMLLRISIVRESNG